jgi:hypothetical protein
MTTTDLKDFGIREKRLASELLTAYKTDKDLTKNFYDDEVTVMFNQNSGYVFLTNSEFQVAMIVDGFLTDFYSCPNCGCEGFESDLEEDGDNCCREYLKEIN